MKEIDILYFDGCPTHESTVELVRETVDRLNVDAEISEIDVRTDEEAAEREFLGSPTVRVDGEDIEPGHDASKSYGRRCRVYSTGNGTSGTPPVEMLEAALLDKPYEAPESSADAGQETQSSDCCSGPSKQTVRLLVADWCPQCPAAKTFWSELSESEPFELEILDIESEEGGQLAAQHGIRGVPAVLIGDSLEFPGTPTPGRTAALQRLSELA